MELPKCKACGQSVLDDDAVDCPFCGASMKTGKPGASKPQAAGARAVVKPKPGATSGAKTAAKPAGSGKPAAVSSGRAAPPMGLDDDDDDFRPPPNPDDDPFELEKKSQGLVIPLRAAPAKGLTLKLTCPMCETVGYASSKAEGANVRCANPKCLVPVFPGPKPKVEEKPVAPPPPPKKSKSPLVVGVLVALLAAGGAGAYFAGVFDGLLASSGPKKPTKEEIEMIRGMDGDTPTVENPENPEDPDKPPVKTGVTGPSVAELRKKAYDALVNLSRDQSNERDKASSRAMAAEIAAASGDLAEARDHAKQLVLRAKNLGFYGIAPLTDIGWKELAAGRRDAAVALANKELAEAAQLLPAFGRKTAEVAPQRAALLVALGQVDEAEKIVEGLGGQSAAFAAVTVPWLESNANGTYDFDAAVRDEPLLPWTAPHRVAVTKLLCLRGQWDAALDWSRRTADPESKVENLVAWADAAVAAGPAGKAPIEKLEPALADVSPAGKARVFATMARRHAEAGRSEQAEPPLETARQLLSGIKRPESAAVPGTKALLDYQPPDPAPFRAAVHAAAEIARAEGALKKDAAGSLDAALAYARGIGPALTTARDLLATTDNDADLVRDMLKSALKLTSADEVRLTFNKYRTRLARLNEAAKLRFEVQSRLLAGLAQTELRSQVWDALRKAAAAEGDDREPYFESAAPWELLLVFNRLGASDTASAEKANEVRQALEAAQVAPPPEIVLKDSVDRLLKEGKPADAAALIEGSALDKSYKERLTLITAGQMVQRGPVESAFSFLRGFKDSVLREGVTAHAAALASRAGHAAKVWAATETKNLPQSDKAALIRGYLMGMQSPAS